MSLLPRSAVKKARIVAQLLLSSDPCQARAVGRRRRKRKENRNGAGQRDRRHVLPSLALSAEARIDRPACGRESLDGVRVGPRQSRAVLEISQRPPPPEWRHYSSYDETRTQLAGSGTAGVCRLAFFGGSSMADVNSRENESQRQDDRPPVASRSLRRGTRVGPLAAESHMTKGSGFGTPRTIRPREVCARLTLSAPATRTSVKTEQVQGVRRKSSTLPEHCEYRVYVLLIKGKKSPNRLHRKPTRVMKGAETSQASARSRNANYPAPPSLALFPPRHANRPTGERESHMTASISSGVVVARPLHPTQAFSESPSPT